MMAALDKRERSCRALVLAGLLLFVYGLIPPPLSVAQRRGSAVRGGAAQSGESAGVLLARGEFYLNNNNVSDKAAEEFKLLMRKYPNSAEAEKAQFFLGGYYHRKYNILSQRMEAPENFGELEKARVEYESYIKRYSECARCEYLADAHFNLSIVFMQLGQPHKGSYVLTRMKDVQHIDSKVYIYQIVWSSSSKDVIDGHFDTGRLADYTYMISKRDFRTFQMLLKAWCRSEKSKN